MTWHLSVVSARNACSTAAASSFPREERRKRGKRKEEVFPRCCPERSVAPKCLTPFFGPSLKDPADRTFPEFYEKGRGKGGGEEERKKREKKKPPCLSVLTPCFRPPPFGGAMRSFFRHVSAAQLPVGRKGRGRNTIWAFVVALRLLHRGLAADRR